MRVKKTRNSGTSEYLEVRQKRNLHAECETLGIRDEPCYEHCNEQERVVIMRPDVKTEEYTNWRVNYKFVTCEVCGWMVGKKLSKN